MEDAETQAAYFEFTNNTFMDIFAEKGAVVHSQIKSRSDNGTYAIFNITGDAYERVQNGVLLIEGYSHDVVSIMQEIKITDCFGDAENAIIDVSQGAFFTMKGCSASNSHSEPDLKVRKSEALFNTTFNVFSDDNSNFTVLNRVAFANYLESATAEALFTNTNT